MGGQVIINGNLGRQVEYIIDGIVPGSKSFVGYWHMQYDNYPATLVRKTLIICPRVDILLIECQI